MPGRSPKPAVAGSSPAGPVKSRDACRGFFHARQDSLPSRPRLRRARFRSSPAGAALGADYVPHAICGDQHFFGKTAALFAVGSRSRSRHSGRVLVPKFLQLRARSSQLVARSSIPHPRLQHLEEIQDDVKLSNPELLQQTAVIIRHGDDKRAVGEDVVTPDRLNTESPGIDQWRRATRPKLIARDDGLPRAE